MSATFRPRTILLPTDGELAILWEDGHESFYPADLLRRECPCATCRSAPPDPPSAPPGGGLLTVLPSGPRAGPPRIRSWEPVGRYAVQLVWQDGHQAGLYSFPLLRALCPCAGCGAAR